MAATADKPYAESAARNAEPILEILRHELPGHSKVLEIGSGTGQHAIRFASELGNLDWQTSDLDDNHAAIKAWISDAGLLNVREPLSLDVMRANVDTTFDSVYSANTAHIMSFEAVKHMFALVAKVLRMEGVFLLYGPFRRCGQFDTDSNARFDASLRLHDPAMGIRDLEALDELAAGHGLRRVRLYRVPANNWMVIWKKTKQHDQ